MTTYSYADRIVLDRELRREAEARIDREAIDRSRSSPAAGAPALPCPRCGASTLPADFESDRRVMRHCLMCGDVRVVPLRLDYLNEPLPQGMHQPRRRAASHLGARI